MPRQLALDACASLSRGLDAVLGPCRDGGFYLLGVRRPLREGTLDHVRWSTADALEDTALALTLAGCTPVRLAPWFDVDDAADLAHLEALLATSAVAAPATLRLLRGA